MLLLSRHSNPFGETETHDDVDEEVAHILGHEYEVMSPLNVMGIGINTNAEIANPVGAFYTGMGMGMGMGIDTAKTSFKSTSSMDSKKPVASYDRYGDTDVETKEESSIEPAETAAVQELGKALIPSTGTSTQSSNLGHRTREENLSGSSSDEPTEQELRTPANVRKQLKELCKKAVQLEDEVQDQLRNVGQSPCPCPSPSPIPSPSPSPHLFFSA